MAAGGNGIANGDMILIIRRKGKNNSQPPPRTAQYTNLTLFSALNDGDRCFVPLPNGRVPVSVA